ncbi:endonuclease III [Candidatus Synechococcus calcipolaris G9]|uniref:Endonuclease III n=1 Tax=Candidatus Synechococcus calcipolaris G9 TaxID=1497997 RepID=A0ABT6ETW1_9SYNE|nr:endonuclease III [Candidatus Synechococcus calcipolaris]MDG2989351.1 endonuclease III [Candidatus Synechococcus calcipolaris G9]
MAIIRKLSANQQRALEILIRLKRLYPDAKCSLTYASPVQLLVATILSAQCTDERVNKVTPALFARFADAAAFAEADLGELETLIYSTGFYRNKAKNIKNACQRIVEVYGGQVPKVMEDLLSLAGVARKTANVVLANAYGINMGVTVDTHVKRLSRRLGLTQETDPVKIEQDLMRLVAQPEWENWAIRLIYHGRATCMARNPQCDRCELADLCPSAPPEYQARSPLETQRLPAPSSTGY